MANYTASLIRPFSSHRILLGILLSYFPILSFFAMGYKLRCASTVAQGDYTLPRWDNWADLFMKGFLAKIILFIYALPAIVILFVTIGSTLINIVKEGIGFATLAYANLVKWALIFFIAFLFFYFLFAPAAVLGYTEANSLKAAFSLKTFRRIFTKSYLISWLIAALYFLLILGIFAAIVLWVGPWLVEIKFGNYITYLIFVTLFFVSGVTIWSILGEGFAGSYRFYAPYQYRY